MTAMPDPPATIVALLRVFTEVGIIHQLTNAAAQVALAPALNPSEFGLLQHFSLRGDGKTPTDLARVMQVAKPSMTAMLAKLAHKGFVTLSPDADDARRVRVHMTAAGQTALAGAGRTLSAAVAGITRDLDHDAVIAMLPTLAMLRAHLDQARD